VVARVITATTRGTIDLLVKGRAVTIEGEAFLPGHGSPDFIAYKNSLRSWADGEPLTDDEKDAVLEDLRGSAEERGLTIEVE